MKTLRICNMLFPMLISECFSLARSNEDRMIDDTYEELQRKIRPVMLNNKELWEAGAEDASITLLRTLYLELNTLEYKRKISPGTSRFLYGAILEKAFRMGYVGFPLLEK
jgi:hypothetical protein